MLEVERFSLFYLIFNEVFYKICRVWFEYIDFFGESYILMFILRKNCYLIDLNKCLY